MTTTYDRCLEASRSYSDTRSPEQRAYAALASDIAKIASNMCRYTSDPRWASNGTTVTLVSAMSSELERKLLALRKDAPVSSKAEVLRMAAPAFTPGPWTVRGDEAVGIEPGNGRHLRVAYVDNGFHFIPEDSYTELGGEAYTALSAAIRSANARLISAAPDMHAVCTDLEREFDRQTYDQMKAHDFDAPDDAEVSVNLTAKQIRAVSRALAKAEIK